MRPIARRAFTLVELLVVISIIALLLGLLLPLLVRVRGESQRVACAANLRTWGLAMRMYADANKGYIPREKAEIDPALTWNPRVDNTWEITRQELGAEVWFNVLPRILRVRSAGDYAENNSTRQEFYNSRNPFHCPRAAFNPATAAEYPNFSLAMNAKLIINNVRPKCTQIRNASRTVLFVDGGVSGEAKSFEKQATYEGRPHVQANRVSFRHSGKANFLMFDNHVECIAGKQVVNPATGNIYPPPVDPIWEQ